MGERRVRDRRGSSEDDSHIIHLPFLDDEWDTKATKKDTAQDSTPAHHSAKRAENEQCAKTGTEKHEPDNLGSDNQQSLNKPPTGTSNMMDESPIDKTVDENVEENTDKNNARELTEKEKARLSALKSMLGASTARYEQASRNRRPVFAAGLQVKVLQGDHAGKRGIVLDADYIESRALISLPDQKSPRWIGFRSLGHAD